MPKKNSMTKENLRGTKEKKFIKKIERKRKKILQSRSAKSRNLCVQYLAEREREKERERGGGRRGEEESDCG